MRVDAANHPRWLMLDGCGVSSPTAIETDAIAAPPPSEDHVGMASRITLIEYGQGARLGLFRDMPKFE